MRAGYQAITTPSLNVRTYGPAAKWSASAVRSNGGTASASDLFFGPAQKGTDWAAAFATATGGSADAAFQDYVKRNVDKFTGPTLKGMLVSADLMSWYTAKKQKEIKDASDSIQKTLDAVDTSADFSSRTRSYLTEIDVSASIAEEAALAAAKAAQEAADATAAEKMAAMKAASSGVDITV